MRDPDELRKATEAAATMVDRTLEQVVFLDQLSHELQRSPLQTVTWKLGHKQYEACKKTMIVAVDDRWYEITVTVSDLGSA